jgi:succinyl-diaminopimelate desuccinylase
MGVIMRGINLQHLAERHEDEVVDFTRRLVQTPSLPGHEGEVAKLIQAEMARLGFDEVSTDPVGNVVGWMRGGDGPAVMFNGHMDHVDPGDAAGWDSPPYSGDLADAAVLGRASVDMKGPLAAMITAAGLVRRHGLALPGTLIVACAVMEEIGGLGTRALIERVRPALAVVGEPTNGKLMRGHRGRVELVARVTGRSVHASVPERGVNPHYALANFLVRLKELPMAQNPLFGASSVAPTLYATDQTSANVTPGEARLTLDWRNVPEETADQIVARLSSLLAEDLPPDAHGQVEVVRRRFKTYTDYEEDFPSIFPSFLLPDDHPLLLAAQSILSETLQRRIAIDTWQFATDGGHLMAAGIPTLGFGPGDPALAHTNRERLPVPSLVEAVAGYMAMATGADRLAGQV